MTNKKLEYVNLSDFQKQFEAVYADCSVEELGKIVWNLLNKVYIDATEKYTDDFDYDEDVTD